MNSIKVWGKRTTQVAFLFLLVVLAALAGPHNAKAISFTDLGTSATFLNDIGIDYSVLTGNLITSVRYNSGIPTNLTNVDRFTGAHTDVPGLSGRPQELKVATVRQPDPAACAGQVGGFAPGTIFTGYTLGVGTPSVDAVIVKIDPDGTVHDPWVHLSGSSLTLPGTVKEDGYIRGGLFQDRFCVFNKPGDLFVVTGDDASTGTTAGNVWRITSGPIPTVTHIVRIPNVANTSGTRAHLEGLVVVPNDPTSYGPWAGKLVTGDEDRIYLNGTGGHPFGQNGSNPKIYAINPSTGTYTTHVPVVQAENGTTLNLKVHPEDFDFIEGDFYGNAFNLNDQGTGLGVIRAAPFSSFVASRGNILITQELPIDQDFGKPVDAGSNSGLYQVRWDAAGNQFIATLLTRDTTNAATAPLYQWEHVTFAPAVRAKITIAPNATNEVGAPHTFTVTLSKDLGTGTFVPAQNAHVDVTLTDSNGANHLAFPVTGSCTNSGNNTDVNGQCTITFKSATPGKVTGHATSTLTVGVLSITVQTNGVAPNSGDAVKTYVDANIQITPATATNPVSTNHTLTGHVNINDGSSASYANAPAGTLISFSLVNSGGASAVFVGGINTCTTIGTTGSCTVQISSPTAGSTAIKATTTVSVGGVSLTRTTGDGKAGDSADANKTWGGPSIKLEKTPDGGVFLAGDQLIFTMKVTNVGAVIAPNVSLSDPLLNTNGLTWTVVSVTSTGTITPAAPTTASCSINASQVLTCSNLGNLAAAATVTVVVKTNNVGGVPAVLCNGSKINNIATVSATGIQPVTDSGDYTCACVNKPDGDKDKDGSKDKDKDVSSSDKDKDKDKDVSSSDKDKDKDTKYATLSLSQDKDKDKDTGVSSDKDKDKDKNNNNSCPADNNDKDKDKDIANTDKDKDTDKNSKKS